RETAGQNRGALASGALPKFLVLDIDGMRGITELTFVALGTGCYGRVLMRRHDVVYCSFLRIRRKTADEARAGELGVPLSCVSGGKL
ncbi:MAG: hypothetical protein ACRDZO_26560, partial [Egibacteraceae bacterium]